MDTNEDIQEAVIHCSDWNTTEIIREEAEMNPLEIAGVCIGAFVLWVLAVLLIIFWNHCANDDPLEDCRDGLKPWPNNWFNSSGS